MSAWNNAHVEGRFERPTSFNFGRATMALSEGLCEERTTIFDVSNIPQELEHRTGGAGFDDGLFQENKRMLLLHDNIIEDHHQECMGSRLLFCPVLLIACLSSIYCFSNDAF